LKKTSHPVATGGSPIVTWLPNQLSAVLEGMVNVWENAKDDKVGGVLGKKVEEVMEKVIEQKDTLRKEVEKYCKERGENPNALSS